MEKRIIIRSEEKATWMRINFKITKDDNDSVSYQEVLKLYRRRFGAHENDFIMFILKYEDKGVKINNFLSRKIDDEGNIVNNDIPATISGIKYRKQ